MSGGPSHHRASVAITAYLFQEKDGSWKAPMQRPKDETPVYKVW
ncbi:MAG TPA: hypothetical protein VIZ69_02745 [Thermoanaerobaculia bacterium]